MSFYMKMKLLLTSIAFVARLSFAQESEELFYKKESRGLRILSLHKEGPLWVEDSFFVEKGNWQQLQNTKILKPHEYQKRVKFLRGSSFEKVLSKEDNFLLDSDILESKKTALWTAEREWTWDWELKFSDWIRHDFDIDFFKRNEIPTDCADLVYAARFIFARINKLAFGFRLAGTGQLMTHDSVPSSLSNIPTDTEWSRDKRFKKALDYLLDNTYTHSLFRDSYPIEVSSQSLIPGSHILQLWNQETGHTRLLKTIATTDQEVADSGPMTYYWSNVPKQIRTLYSGGFWDYMPFEKNKSGFLRPLSITWKNSKWQMKSMQEMPYYSLMQYDPDFMGSRSMFFAAVFDRMFERLDWSLILNKIFLDVESLLQGRKLVVEEGYRICQKENCDQGTANYENYSTPSRDARLYELLYQANLVKENFSEEFPNINTIWDRNMRKVFVQVQGYDLYFNHINTWMAYGLLSSDPRVSVLARWGIPETGTLEPTQDCVSQEKGIDVDYYETPEDEYVFPIFSNLSPYAHDRWSFYDYDWKLSEVANSGRSNNVALTSQTYLYVPEDKVIDFSVTNDDGVRIYLSDKSIMQLEWAMAPTSYSAIQKVKAGFHKLNLLYYEFTDQALLKLQWRNESGEYVSIPPENFYRSCAHYTNSMK